MASQGEAEAAPFLENDVPAELGAVLSVSSAQRSRMHGAEPLLCSLAVKAGTQAGGAVRHTAGFASASNPAEAMQCCRCAASPCWGAGAVLLPCPAVLTFTQGRIMQMPGSTPAVPA